jgi:hypothetical protein
VLCFTGHRINFDGEGIKEESAYNSIFVYFGADQQKFAREFAKFGAIMKRMSSNVVRDGAIAE